MKLSLSWSSLTQRVYAANALQLNPWTMLWEPIAETLPADLETVTAQQALTHISSGKARRVPVAIIGPREATKEEYQTAEELGAALAKMGLQLLCGGKNGVMEASAKGHLEAGGQPIGLLPETDWRGANPYISIPIATGIGKSRNAVIAQACPVLIAVGGGYGTMSEMAYGLHFDHLVLSLCNAPVLPGVFACNSIDDAITRTAEHLLEVPEVLASTLV